jgi:hypothetical protein
MPDNYTVTLRITVSKGEPETLVVMEESTFANLTFAKMTHISAEFYDQIAKLEKEKK